MSVEQIVVIGSQDDVKTLEFGLRCNTCIHRHRDFAYLFEIQITNVLNADRNLRGEVVNTVQVINHSKIRSEGNLSPTKIIGFFKRLVAVPVGCLNDCFIGNMDFTIKPSSLNYFSTNAHVKLII